MHLLRSKYHLIKNVIKRFYCNRLSIEKYDLKSTRNLGIIAHIDAGKTTTTERMLFYSGQTQIMGEVHDGDTVMDFLAQERERGITITSASIAFNWKKHRLNLIDTPGHVDFTIEVERSLSVLDGAVTILDASAGVEAQTYTVWSQANAYNIPRIIYFNKMDKPLANMWDCIKSVEQKLGAKALPIHIPLGKGKSFNGVIDVILMEKVVWPQSNNGDGSHYSTCRLDSSDELYSNALQLREALIGSMSELDDKLAEDILTIDKLENLSVQSLQNALRRITIKQLGFPILCGSSFRNIGVQLLLDSILRYFPSPLEKVRDITRLYGQKFCAFAFKIMFDKRLGCLTFLRIYSGEMKSTQTLYNINRERLEKIGKLYIAFANDFQEVSHISHGNIAVVTGLIHTITGDTLVMSSDVAKEAKKKCASDDSLIRNNVQPIFASIKVPEPVFFCSIESPSLSKLKQLELALNNLQREDPSFKVTTDKDSGQVVIKGMGELHIEVIKDRILKEYGVDAYLGPLQVSYRETINQYIEEMVELTKNVGGVKNYIKISLAVKPNPNNTTFDRVRVLVTKENDLGKLRADHFKAIEHGVSNALDYGPLLSFPVINVSVDLLWFETTRNTSIPMITSASNQCIMKCLKNALPTLLEPYMSLEIITPEKYIGSIISDLSMRRSQIGDMQSRAELRVIKSVTPLSELINYSTFLRTLTSGTSSFSMEFHSYQHMNDVEQNKAIQQMTGFAVN